jgi:lysophospholipase L1-like esterase
MQFIACAFVALILPLLAFAQPAETADVPAVKPEFHTGTEDRHERFNVVSKEGKAELVFLGDSITQGWEGAGRETWEKHYANRHAANFGISGDRTEHVLWRLDHGNFDGLSPKLIVIMIGTNNTGHRKDPATDTASGVAAILDRLKVKCPDSKVLLLGVFPREEKPHDELRVINARVNVLLEKMADNKRVFYKDIGKVFLSEQGVLSKDIMPDLLHLSAKGYELWAQAIEKDVVRLLEEESESAPKK